MKDIIFKLASDIYFDVIDTLEVRDKCVENDPDNEGGTKNTELGQQLYFGIEKILEDKLK